MKAEFYHPTWEWCIEEAQRKLHGMLYTPVTQLRCEYYHSKEPLPFARRFEGEHRTLEIGQSWGDLFDCGWFHFTGPMPEGDPEDYVVRIDISGEGLLVDGEGNPVMGLTNLHSIFDAYHGCEAKREPPAKLCTADGKTVDIWVDGACNDLFGGDVDNGMLALMEVASVNEEAVGLYYDLEVLVERHATLDPGTALARRLYRTIQDAVISLATYSDEELKAAREILRPMLEAKNGFAPVTMTAVGHAHLDLAWLWPERETIRKGARTFATALRNMEKYPDYVFGASQAQLYQWMKDTYPALYEQVRQRIAEGRWDVQGAMWVEADTNLAGGEALIRQIVYGKAFFMKEFGIDVQVLWLPDVFGYTAAFPQMLKKCGVPYFFTNKLCFNKNRIPHHTFLWQGIDGTEVLAHLTPTDTYGARMMPEELVLSQESFKDVEVSDEALLLFGVSDGGGGPGREHLERFVRQRNLVGLPPVNPGTSQEFFQRLETNRHKYAKWVGELYFENHQATYTTQAKIKKYNRRAEDAVRRCEMLCTIAARETDFTYPYEEMERIWKRILFLQFHDILPGSSIKRVYDEAEAEYPLLLAELEGLSQAAVEALGWSSVNLTGGVCSGYVEKEGVWYQATAKPFAGVELTLAEETLTGLENAYFSVKVGEDGYLTSVYDKQAGRELLKHGTRGNVFTVFPDEADAWELPVAYQKKPRQEFRLVSSELKSDGPQTVYSAVYRYGQSEIRQDMTVTAGSRELRFDTTVDWQETGRLLRTVFDMDVQCTEAVCGIQMGQLRRPTHANTSWDVEKYEICANRYVDLSEESYGVALLSDCKYGYNVRGNVLDLCLLRSSMWPGRHADKGVHTFTYVLYPHMGNTAQGGVAQVAETLNRPWEFFAGAVTPPSYLSVDSANIVVEALKPAEDGDGYVLRLYEAYGARVDTALTVKGMTRCVQTDMLERPERALPVEEQTAALQFLPYEIKTLRFY